MNIINKENFPKNWDQKKIGTILISSQYGTNEASVEDGHFEIVGMKDIQDGKILTENLAKANLNKDDKDKFTLHKGDILINRTNSYDLVGKVGIYNSEKEVGFASYLVRLSIDNKKADSVFINFWLNSYLAQGIIKRIATRAVSQANINPTEFKKFCPIPLPPLPEQKAIADSLSTWDDAIDRLERLIKAKEKRFRWLLRSLIGEKNGWKQVKLGDLGEIVTGNTPPKNDSSNYGGHYCWATAEDFTNRYIHDTTIKLSEKGKRVARFVPPGSVLVTCIGSIGLNAIASVPLATNQQINSIVPEKNYNSDFIYYLILYGKNKLIKFAGAGGILMLSKNQFSKIVFKIPSLEEQQEIAGRLSDAQREIDILKRMAEKYKAQKRGLMQKMLTGQWRVNAAVAEKYV